VLGNPLFAKILRELEAEGHIDWQVGSTKSIQEDISVYPTKIDWLLEKYEQEGAYDGEAILVKRLANPAYWMRTVALSAACGETITLAKSKLRRRDTLKVLNTLFHERVHAFCFVHPQDQTRTTNQCDPAYIAGDLAEILVSHHQGKKERWMDKPICPALLQKVKAYRLIEII